MAIGLTIGVARALGAAHEKGIGAVRKQLHCETPGVYRILPTVAFLNYYPEIRGNSAPARARVIDASVSSK